MSCLEKAPPILSRPKPMKVLVLGLCRTGTSSLYKAQKELGLTPYHFLELLRSKDNEHPRLWLEVMRAKYDGTGRPPQLEDFEQVLRDYDSVSDTPACLLVEDLIAAYPEAKVILTVRTPESWLRSMQTTILRVLTWRSWEVLAWFDRDLSSSSSYWPLHNLIMKVVSKGHSCPWKPSASPDLLQYFDDHYDLVRRVVPKDRLLEFHPSQGWGPLCEFLDLPVPDREFPHVNDGEAFISYHATLYWSRWRAVVNHVAKTAGLLGLVLGGVWWISRSALAVGSF